MEYSNKTSWSIPKISPRDYIKIREACMSDSVVTKFMKICFYCGRTAECVHHLIPGVGRRELAEIDGLKLPSCNKHHNTGATTEQIHGTAMTETLSKMLGQAIWEKEYVLKALCSDKKQIEELRWKSRDEFMKRYGKSYI